MAIEIKEVRTRMRKLAVLFFAVVLIGGCAKTSKSTLPLVLTVPFFEDVWGGVAYDVTCDSSDNVYVVGYGYNSPKQQGGVSPAYWGIRKFSSSGTETTAAWSDNPVTAYPNGWNRPYAVKIDSTGNVYVAGTITDDVSGTYTDWYVMKFSSAGAVDSDWNKQFGTSGAWDEAYALGIDSLGDVYVAGYLFNGVTNDDWWIQKFEGTTGDVISTGWDKKIDSSSANGEMVQSVVIDGSNNVYVAGISGSDYDLTLKKFDYTGAEDTTNWDKTISINYDPSIIKNPFGQRLALDSSGENVYYIGSGIDQDSVSTGVDWIIKKFSSDGSESATWNKAIDGGGDAEAFAVAVDSEDNVYVVGYGINLHSATSGRDWWIKKFDSNGDEIISGWNKIIHGGHSNADALETAYGVAIDSGDNVYVVGTVVPSTGGNIWRIVKYAGDGTEQFRK